MIWHYNPRQDNEDCKSSSTQSTENGWLDWKFWSALILLAIRSVGLVMFSPQERSLGSGIRSVYIHVALVWASLTVIDLAGLTVANLLLGPTSQLSAWLGSVGLVGLVLIVAGLGVSVLTVW